MARKIKFALEMANGKKVNTLEELQEHGDIETVLQYFYNKRLMKWLDDHDADDASRALAELDEQDEKLAEQIAEILGLNVESVAVDMAAIREKEEKERRIKAVSSNQAVLEHLDMVAMSQAELDSIMSGIGTRDADDVANSTTSTNSSNLASSQVIYLLGDESQEYVIDTSKGNIEYIGLGDKLTIDIGETSWNELVEAKITFTDIALPASMEQEKIAEEERITKTRRDEVVYRGSSETQDLPIQVNRENARQMSYAVQDKLKEFVYDPSIKTDKLKQAVIDKLDNATFDLHIRSSVLKDAVKGKLDGFEPTLHRRSEELKAAAMSKLENLSFDL